MTAPTSHTTTVAAGTPVPAAWRPWSTAWTRQARTITGRPDAAVTVAPGAGGGAPACCIPATAEIEVDADLIADPTIADPGKAGHKQAVPAAYGALVHECAHVAHSRWDTPPGTPPVVAEVARLLEESRAEHHHRNRRWLRHAVNAIVAPADAPTDTPWNAAKAAALLLARVDAQVLYPADVRRLRAPITAVLGRARLQKLRRIWLQAHTLADTDATTMIELGWRWCRLLDIDPDIDPWPPMDTATSRRIAAAIGAVLGHLAGAATTTPPAPPTPPDPPPDRSGRDTPLTWTRRPPTDTERLAARHLGARLRQARTREPARRRDTAAVPPGRLRTRAALTAAAQRAAGAIPTAQPWQRTTRRPAPDPQLSIAILVDVSGSMRAFAAPLSSAAWILAHAGHHAGAATTTIAFGDLVTTLTTPGHRPADVCDMRADSNTERFDDAVARADQLLGLTTPGAARLLVVVSDGNFVDRPAAQKTLDRLRAAGVGVLWLAPAGKSTHTYTGVTTIAVDDPATCIGLIGRAAANTLAQP